MSVTSYDVIIVGSGPAGAGAALEFCQTGLEVVILEKSSMPRNKPCGGATPRSTEQFFNFDISPVIANRTPQINYLHNYHDEVTFKIPGDKAPLLINRSAFDEFLIKQALREGKGNIVLYENCHAEFDSESDRGVSVTVNGTETIKAQFLIAADGANSRFASSVKLLPKKEFALACEADIITNNTYYQAHSHEMVMNLFCLPLGYGWIFPKQPGRFSCGVGAWGRPLNLRKELDRFLARSIPAQVIQQLKISNHPIPIFQGTERIATKRVFLAGDAAALVNPVSGEGIRFALLSGKLAASAIIKHLQNTSKATKSSTADEYQQSVNEHIGNDLTNKLKFFSLAFQAAPDYFYKTFVKNKQTPPSSKPESYNGF